MWKKQLLSVLKVVGNFLWLFSLHLLTLLWETTRYLGRRLLDSVYLLRIVFLRRTKRRFPERASEAESRMASLREKRTGRWERWRAVPVWRRVEVHVALLGILVAAVLLIRSHLRSQQLVAVSGIDASEQAARDSDLAEAVKIAKEVRSEFEAQLKNSSPGQWVFYGHSHNWDPYKDSAWNSYTPAPTYAFSWAQPILEPGDFDQWDYFKVTSPVVMKEGNRYRMWYVGCNFSGEEYKCGIGHAVSEDGISWRKRPEPLFLIEDPAQSKGLDTIAVVRAGGRYLLWYSILPDWRSTNNFSTVYFASSADGVTWKQEGAVLRSLREGWSSIRLSALYDGVIFHLWYVDTPVAGGAPALLHVTSSDGKKWQIGGSTFLADLSIDLGRLWVIREATGGYRGFFAYRDSQEMSKSHLLGMLSSTDGNSWQRADDNLSAYFELGKADNGFLQADEPVVLEESGDLWLWYVIRPPNGADAISVAYRKEGKS